MLNALLSEGLQITGLFLHTETSPGYFDGIVHTMTYSGLDVVFLQVGEDSTLQMFLQQFIFIIFHETENDPV